MSSLLTRPFILMRPSSPAADGGVRMRSAAAEMNGVTEPEDFDAATSVTRYSSRVDAADGVAKRRNYLLRWRWRHVKLVPPPHLHFPFFVAPPPPPPPPPPLPPPPLPLPFQVPASQRLVGDVQVKHLTKQPPSMELVLAQARQQNAQHGKPAGSLKPKHVTKPADTSIHKVATHHKSHVGAIGTKPDNMADPLMRTIRAKSASQLREVCAKAKLFCPANASRKMMAAILFNHAQSHPTFFHFQPR